MEPIGKIINYRKLREVRKRSGKSISEVARKIGLTPNGISGFEKGRSIPSIPSFHRVISEYDADLFEILEILQFLPVDPSDLRSFRATCKAEGRHPDEVIRTMIKVYSGLKTE